MNDLDFLKEFEVENEIFTIASGEQVLIQKYHMNFKSWAGKPIPNTYNGKAVLDWNGEPVFAELATLRLFQSNGWDGVWVDSYRKVFRNGLPDVVDPVEIPKDRVDFINTLRNKTGIFGGCWDVFVWKDDTILFVELKRSKKDRIQQSQIKWLDCSIQYGLKPENFRLLEWDF